MSDESRPSKLKSLIALLPVWLWISAGLGFVSLTGFLVYLSQQQPDQYAMTIHPPWKHSLNHGQLIAYHKAIKYEGKDIEELDAKRYFNRQSSSAPLYAQSQTITAKPTPVLQTSPNRTLTMAQAQGFASRPEPLNQYSLQQAQEYVALERNRAGMLTTSQIAKDIPKGIYVQTASLRSVADAAKLRETLKNRGFSPFIQEAFVKRQTWYRVRLGPFSSLADAQQTAQKLRSNQYSAQVIKQP